MNERKREFLCRVKGCPEAVAGRLYAGQGLSAHYTFVHGNAAEGSRQIKLQRKQLATRLEEESQAITELPAMEVRTFDEAGEPIPAVTVAMPVKSFVESAGEVDIRQILEEHVGRIQDKLVDIQHRIDADMFELKRLQDELNRAVAAQNAYKLEEKAKSNEVGSTDDDADNH